MILLTEPWERESANGRRYFAGYLAKAKVLLIEDGPHPDRPGVTVWKLFVAENERQDQRQAPRTDHGRDRAGRYEQPQQQRPAQQRRDQRARAQAAGRPPEACCIRRTTA